MPKYTKTEIAESLAHLSTLLVKPVGEYRNASHEEMRTRQKIYVVIRSVARSGMSRTMDFFVTDSDGDLRWITADIARITDCSRAKDGSLKISGCGMDMRFAVLDHLARKMWGLSGNVFNICDI